MTLLIDRLTDALQQPGAPSDVGGNTVLAWIATRAGVHLVTIEKSKIVVRQYAHRALDYRVLGRYRFEDWRMADRRAHLGACANFRQDNARDIRNNRRPGYRLSLSSPQTRQQPCDP